MILSASSNTFQRSKNGADLNGAAVQIRSIFASLKGIGACTQNHPEQSVPIFHSRDLLHWRQIGHCLTLHPPAVARKLL
jgi:hypothetical protein